MGDRPDRSERETVDKPPRKPRTPPAPSGAKLALQHTTRPMKVYPVVESDLAVLKGATFSAGVAFSVGSAFIGYAVNIYINAKFYAELGPAAKALISRDMPICIGIGASLIVAGLAFSAWRTCTWLKIKRSAEVQPLTAGPR